MSGPTLAAPFPWFGGKSRAASLIWEAMGDCPNFVEPFFGSGAVLLARPHAPGVETVNDLDGFVCNAWRGIRADPEAVAHYADCPSNECDLHARHAWLVPRRAALTEKLMGNPDYYDAKIAGWWVWGLCCWIGSGWCSGDGPWQSQDGVFAHVDAGQGVQRKRPHLGDAGQGVQRKRPLVAWMQALADRLRRVRVCCGDWARVLTPSVTVKHGLTGVILDPPYSHSERDSSLYAIEADIAPAIQAWCLANGDNPLLRIVLCGYDEEYTLPGWRVVAWKANGGMGNTRKNGANENNHRERLWLSPACLQSQLPLFGGAP